MNHLVVMRIELCVLNVLDNKLLVAHGMKYSCFGTEGQQEVSIVLLVYALLALMQLAFYPIILLLWSVIIEILVNWN